MDLASDEVFELKLIFLRELGGGHATAKAALEALQNDPADRAAVQELRNFFHKIAGTALAVDLGLLGQLSAACETTADAVLDGSLAPGGRHALSIFSEGLAGVASVLEGEVKSEQAARTPLTDQQTVPLAAGAQSRVLVVDDDPFSARLIDGVLRAAGFASSFVCEPEKAFDTILHENPDLIILDVVMPGMDGFRLCQRVRAHPGLQLTPIIFVTRKGDVEQRVRGLAVGGNDYVAKPFEPQELVARVRAHQQRLAELRELAVRDGLTRCYNSKYFKMRLEQEIGRTRRYKSGLVLGVLDVDHFKRINDGYGHPAGDAVLVHLATLLTSSVRSTDMVARYGGEEFAFLLIEATAAEGTMIVERMRERVARHRFEVPALKGDAINLGCTVSIGLAACLPDDTPFLLLQRADSALYEAKNSGRNRVWVAP